ncbi:MAG TPA: pyruvate dehydrogenase, partial [Planctomycetota bacterium]|nr:pyruvate dehydrogenase [Planctomycetota bacterium]
GYEPGENVVELFVMGALVPEAVRAAEMLLDRGVYANVTVVTSPDLLCGELARSNGYEHLTRTLAVNGRLHLRASGGDRAGKDPGSPLGPGDAIGLAGRRVPIVSVHDGEIGLLDNLGSVVGVPQVAKAVVKFSKSGTPAHIYRYHGLHDEGIAEACGEALARTALEQVQLDPDALVRLRAQADASAGDWRELWPNPV